MKNKYKVVALVPLEFSVEGNSDSKEAIESVKNIFEACRDDNDCADIVFDGIEESLRHDSIEYKVEAAQPEPEVNPFCCLRYLRRLRELSRRKRYLHRLR